MGKSSNGVHKHQSTSSRRAKRSEKETGQKRRNREREKKREGQSKRETHTSAVTPKCLRDRNLRRTGANSWVPPAEKGAPALRSGGER